jgi:hypothetical protein
MTPALTKDEAWRIAANIAQLLELVTGPSSDVMSLLGVKRTSAAILLNVCS